MAKGGQEINEPDDYQKYFHRGIETGNVWIDGKGKHIPLNVPLSGQHVDNIGPTTSWNSRQTGGKILQEHPAQSPVPTIITVTL